MRPKQNPTRLFTAALLLSPILSLLLPHGLAAQAPVAALATPQIRVIAPVAGSAWVALKGNTSPLAKAQYDRGAAAPTQASGRLRLLLKRSPEQAQALTEYLGSLHDPNSPSYHKWLTPASFGANFGIADADLEAVEAWLASQGLKVESVPASRNFVEFSGTLGQVGQAFHTSIHNYSIAGVNHLSNVSDPQIPAALTPVVAGVSPLNDFRAKPMHVVRDRVQMAGQGGTVPSTQTGQNGATPSFTGLIGQTDFLYLAPADMATIYNAPNSFNRNYAGTAPGNEGAGVNIGIANYSNLNAADYANYRRLFLNESSPKAANIIVDGVDPGVLTEGDGTEALIDAEFSSALAPQANIYFYTSASDILDDGLNDSILRAIEDNNVALLSVSYGQCEYQLGQSGNAFYSELWQQAAAQGITPIVSTGDSGSATCDAGQDPGVAATGGLSVSGIASTPYDIAVGGTDFNVLLHQFNTYVGANNTSHGSAKNPIPENPWNDSISNDPVGSYTTNLAATYPVGNANDLILAAGSGGPSTAGACTQLDQYGGCLSPGYAAPSYQTGLSVYGPHPAGVRFLPDVSLFASPGDLHPAAWALCSDSTTDGLNGFSFNNANGTASINYVDCSPGGDGSFYLEPVGGTSASAPAFAGILADVIASLPAGTRLGIANDVLYNLFSKGNTGAFNDVTAGNNSVPCQSGSLNCILNSANQYFESGYDAGTGYDLATGLGSVNISKLVSQWTTATFTSTSLAFTVNGSTSPAPINHGSSVALNAVITPGTATGLVSVTGKLNQGPGGENDYITLTNGSGTTNSVALPGGTYNLHAYYPGDVNDAASTSNTVQVKVNPEASVTGLQIQAQDPVQGTTVAPAATATYGQYIYAYVSPAPSSGATNYGTPSGTATLSYASTTVTQSMNSSGLAPFTLDLLAPGTYSFTAHYNGDPSYNSSTSAAVPLTISKGPTQLTLTPASTTISASGSTTVKVELDTDSVGAYPTGAITLTAGSNSFPGTAVAQGLTQYGAVDEIVTFNVPGSALAGGVNTLTATFAGDTNYSNASKTTTITNSGGSTTAPGFSLFSQNQNVTISAPGQSSAPDTITVTPSNGFSGTVNLTCQVQFSVLGSAPTCSLGSSSVNVANGNAATTTVTLHTTGSSASLTRPAGMKPGSSAPALAMRLLASGGGLAVCSVLLWGIPARRRSWRQLRSLRSLGLLLLTAGALGILGCGGTSTNNSSNGTPAGSYVVTITGTATGVNSSNTQITVNVQ